MTVNGVLLLCGFHFNALLTDAGCRITMLTWQCWWATVEEKSFVLSSMDLKQNSAPEHVVNACSNTNTCWTISNDLDQYSGK